MFLKDQEEKWSEKKAQTVGRERIGETEEYGWTETTVVQTEKEKDGEIQAG